MHPIPERETTNAVTFKVGPSPDLMVELRLLDKQEGATRLAEIVEDHYTWDSEENQRVAFEHIEALRLAVDMALSLQIDLHFDKVFDRLTKDMAETVYRLAQAQFGYTGELQYIHQVVSSSNEFRRFYKFEGYEWVFAPLNQFPKLIPLHALKAKQVVSTTPIVQPEAYWVANLVPTPTPLFSHTVNYSSSAWQNPTVKLDPILCAQYGNWLAGIAMWL